MIYAIFNDSPWLFYGLGTVAVSLTIGELILRGAEYCRDL
jgi:hypothetical protein